MKQKIFNKLRLYWQRFSGAVKASGILKPLKEYTALIVAIVLFFVSPPILHFLDPEAATYDAGVLQVINLAIIQFCTYMAITWIVLQHMWKVVGDYLKTDFTSDFKSLTPCTKVIISLSLYFALFSILVILSRVFMKAS